MENDYMVVDKLTGEVLCTDAVAFTSRAQKEAAEKKKGWKGKNTAYECYGSFIWLYRDSVDNLSLDSSTLFRLMYAVSYMNYDNKLVYGNGKKIGKKALKELLNLKDKAFREFVEKTKDVLIVCKDEIEVSKGFAKKGNLKKNEQNLVTRLYSDAIQTLYNGTKPSQQKQLGYLLKLIPYLNIKFNMLCQKEDVFEGDSKIVRPLTLEQICDIVGYDKTNASRLKRELLNYTCNKKPIIAMVCTKDLLRSTVFINPSIFGSSDRNDVTNLIGKVFD